MVQRVIVSLYEVDEWATTGPWAGQGSLVEPTLVLVHPPLSNRIADGRGPMRLRTGITQVLDVPGSDAATPGVLVEVIDVMGEPRVLRGSTSEQPAAVVGLELRTPARAVPERFPGPGPKMSQDEFLAQTAKYLQERSEDDWAPWDERDPTPFCKMFGLGCKRN